MAEGERIFELQPSCQSSSGVGSSVFCPFSEKKEACLVESTWYWRCQRVKIYNSGVEMAYFCGIFGTRGQERRDAQALPASLW